MVPQELILSACSTAQASSSSTNKASSSAPAIQLHDLTTSAHVQSFKTSSNTAHSLALTYSHDGVGGTVWAVQEGKAIVGIWAWQKDQQHLKLHLPEKLSCLAISPNGVWAAGGSPNGQIYLWEIASGLMLASWNAHYRAVSSLSFTGDSTLLLSSSPDAAVHVFMVARLLDDDSSTPYGKPYGSLTDHTLAISSLALGKTTGSSGGRCWTAAEDGTVKMWSLHAPFDLLATFVLPPGTIPSALAVDPAERFLYVGSTAGNVYHIPLFKRKAQIGQVEAVGGEGLGSAAIKSEMACISVESPITCLALSLSATDVLVGTRAGDIHVHSLPSHQHLRTISSHGGPISHLSTMPSPADLVGRPFRSEDWTVMDIKNLERMRIGRAAKDVQEVGVILRPSGQSRLLTKLRNTVGTQTLVADATGHTQAADHVDTAALQDEVKRLRVALDKAVKINEKMWNGVVDLKLAA